MSMPKTKLTKDDGKVIEHSGTGAMTMTHIHWTGSDEGHIEIEWQFSSKEELLTIATEFLKWLDVVAPNGGVAENAIKNWGEETGRLNAGMLRLRHKQAEHPNAQVDKG